MVWLIYEVCSIRGMYRILRLRLLPRIWNRGKRLLKGSSISKRTWTGCSIPSRTSGTRQVIFCSILPTDPRDFACGILWYSIVVVPVEVAIRCIVTICMKRKERQRGLEGNYLIPPFSYEGVNTRLTLLSSPFSDLPSHLIFSYIL